MHLKNRILGMTPFKYYYKEEILNKMLRLCRCCISDHTKLRAKRRHLLYIDGVEKLQKEFDIVSIIQSVRKMRLVTDIFLARYQKALVPYFKANLLKHHKIKE